MHLALEHPNLVDKALADPIAVGLHERVAQGLPILGETLRERLKVGDVARRYLGEPRLKGVRRAPSEDALELAAEGIGALDQGRRRAQLGQSRAFGRI
jgi:hypothetical protein